MHHSHDFVYFFDVIAVVARMSLLKITFGITRESLRRNPKKSRRNQNYTTTTAIEMNCTHCSYSVGTKDAFEQNPSINR